MQPMDLVWPAAQYLPGYVHALQQGWSPDNLWPRTALDDLARIAQDPSRFLSEQIDREAKGPNGPAIVLPDGSTVPRLPGYSRWMCVVVTAFNIQEENMRTRRSFFVSMVIPIIAMPIAAR